MKHSMGDSARTGPGSHSWPEAAAPSARLRARRRASTLHWLASGFLTPLVLSSCFGLSAASGPIRTSLVDLTGEARSVSVGAPGFFSAEIATHKQALSIGGLLNIPDVGQEFEFPGKDDVTTAVGISVVQSYRLIGEGGAPDDPTLVTQVRGALEEVQQLALRATTAAAELSERANAGEDLPTAGARVSIETLRERRDRAEAELEAGRKRLNHLANTPGIIIARWDQEERSGVIANLFGLGEVSSKSKEGRSGFVVLGGLRVVSLVLGEDFWWLINNLRPHEKKHIEQIGIVTQMLQARDVAYTSGLTLEIGTDLLTSLRRDGGFSKLDDARIAGYWSFAGTFLNAGNLPRIEWKREPMCMVCGLDLPGLAEPKDRALQQHFDVHEDEGLAASSFQGWRTVSANITYVRDICLFHSWSDHASKYSDPRRMHSAPSCSYCGDSLSDGTPKDVAIVPGRDSGAGAAEGK